MCKVFTNQFTDDSVSEAIESLQALIQLRPEGYTEIKKIIQDVFIEVEHDSKDDQEDEADNPCKNTEDAWFTEQTTTIKAASPFTKIYLEIESTTITADNDNINLLYNRDFFFL
jgi:hypothetical protein